jgi:transposase
MARAYSDDLRRKLLEAHKEGEGSLGELAGRFHVSEGWARKVSAALHRTGQMERQPGARRGRKSRITPHAIEYLQSRVKALPDRTLAELQEDLRSQQKIEIGITRLWILLKQIGLRLKKSHSMPPSRTAKESKRNVSSGGRKRGTSIRRSLSSSTKAASRRK